MSKVFVYFGAPPSRGQIVSDNVRARGIELLKIEPSKVTFHGAPTTVQPGFALYKSFLPLFIRLALGVDVTDFSNPWGTIPVDVEGCLPIPLPELAVTWAVPVGEEVRAQMRENGFRDTVIKGRPAMIHPRPTSAVIRVALNHRTIETSPCTENSVNIFAMRKLIIIINILSQFLRCHQYPAFIDADHETEYNKAYQVLARLDTTVTTVGGSMETDDDDADGNKELRITRRFKCSLQTPPSDFAIFNDEHSMPKNEGTLFPYIPELAKFDRTTVLECIRRYFYCALGDTPELANDEYEDLVAAWGNIQNTDCGNILSHLCKVIDISLTMQACPHVMMTAGQYDGVYMEGSAYHLNIMDTVILPSSREEITENIRKMDHHANALWAILLDLDYPSDDDRLGDFQKIRTMWQLKARFEYLKLNGGTGVRDRILKNAINLHFPGERYLDPTAVNIDNALSFISDPSKDLTTLGPFHPSLLLSTDRIALALGAFGFMAPSFRVPGGKEMSLTQPFRITNAIVKKERGPFGHKDVTKIAAIMEPLEIAVTHMKKVIELKTILNPFGNAIVNASASHMNKEYAGDSCTLLVEALRKVARVTVVDQGGRGRKRPADEDSSSRKRGRTDVGF